MCGKYGARRVNGNWNSFGCRGYSIPQRLDIIKLFFDS